MKNCKVSKNYLRFLQRTDGSYPGIVPFPFIGHCIQVIKTPDFYSGSKSFLFYLMLLFVLLAGCNNGKNNVAPEYSDSTATQTIPVYHFAVHPLHNPTRLIKAYQPMIDYLNEKIKTAHFILEASRDYRNFEQKYRSRKLEFILPNPWQTLQAIKSGYVVIARAGHNEDFRGLIIVRKDATITQPSDLAGKTIAYPSATALAACIMPQYYLFEHGVDINKDVKNIYVGSQESALMNVFLNQAAAGGTWPPPWRLFQKDHPEQAVKLKVIWETEWLINNSVMIRDDIPADIRNHVQQYLAALSETPQGKDILKGMETSRFIPATNEDYNIVQAYIDRFEKEVRKIDVYEMAK